MVVRSMVLLKPLRSGVSGFARLWMENGRRRLQLSVRGAVDERVSLYAYRRGEADEKLGDGSGVIEAEGFRAADGLMVVGGGRPLMVGVCGEASESALMEVSSAAESLCRRLAPKAAVREAVSLSPAPKVEKPSVPREVFLPAIDPLPYVSADDNAPEPLLPPPRPSGPPADRLRPLRWPRGFDVLRPYFEKNLPRALFPMPGWRFVPAAQGLWIGMQREYGRVRRVAYACEGRTPPAALGAWRALKGQDGRWYQVLEQEVSAG